jgi:hypothetical protein
VGTTMIGCASLTLGRDFRTIKACTASIVCLESHKFWRLNGVAGHWVDFTPELGGLLL